MKGKKREPWRIVVGILVIAFIVYMWVEKDIASTYTALPKEQLLPMVVTNVAVTMLKVLVFAGIVWAVRRIGRLLTQKK